MKYRVFLDLVEKATGVKPTHSFISAKLGGKPKAGALGNRYFCDGNISDQELLVLIPHFPTVDFSPYLNIDITNLNTNLISNSVSNETNQKGRSFKIPYWNGISADLIKKYGVDDVNVDLQIIINDWHANPENLIFIAMPGDDMDGCEYPLKNKDTLIVDTSRNNISESGIYFCTTHGHTRVYVRRIIEKMTDEILCVTTVDNPRYKSIIEKKWTEEMWKQADVQVIGRVIKNMSYSI